MIETAIQLLTHQRDWLLDQARFKMALWCRQCGKSFGVALEAVDNAVESGKNWVLLSRGERQSRELMEKVKMHAKAYAIGASAIEEDRYRDDSGDGNEYQMLTVTLNNGARLIGLPANPDTARGFSANTILDEFAIHKDSLKIWAAMYGTITRGYKVRIVSTPMGRQNKFYQLWTGTNNYTKHFCDIYQAVKNGLDVDVAELRAGLDDDEIWAQEYECQFLDEATAFLTFDMIAECESEQASESFEPRDGIFYCGIDIGRRRDLTVLWIAEQLGDTLWTRAVICLEKTPFPKQIEILSDYLSVLKPVRTCIDYTGMGGPICEQLQKQFGAYAVEPVTFGNLVKQDLATRTRQLFEDHRVRIPASTKIRNDLHAVKKTVTAAGNIRFDAERTKDGHSDRFWALALALMAAHSPAAKPTIICLTAGDDEDNFE